MVNPSIFKAYDIRGIYPKDINENNICDIARAIYTYFTKKTNKEILTVAVGHDMRLSSPQLFKAVKDVLVQMGATVVDLGLASTPTVYGAVIRYGYDVGIQVSASHNPKEYNGLKFFRRVGKHLDKVSKENGMEEVKKIALAKNFIKSINRGKITAKKTALVDGIIESMRNFPVEKFKNFVVAADAANSMGALYLAELFNRLPKCKLIKMNFSLDGNFPAHQPDPLQKKNLADLQKKVIAEKADLGIEPDGDGDRVFFVDEHGKIIQPTLISSLIVREILSKKPGQKVIVDVRYTKNVENASMKYGGTAVISKVGHALITSLLNKEGAEFAGESSGHYYYRQRGGTESAILTILHVLNVMAREKKPISQILKDLETSIESGEINFVLSEKVSANDILKMVAKDYHEGKISFLDGISVDYPDWRFNIRTSNTEPLLRLNVEGKTKKTVCEKLEELENKLIRKGAKLKD